MLRETMASMEAWWSGIEVGSGGGHHFFGIDLIFGRGETRSYKIISPPKPRGCHTLLVAKEDILLATTSHDGGEGS